jgi:uncharacterized delta-60 repeat protein
MVVKGMGHGDRRRRWSPGSLASLVSALALLAALAAPALALAAAGDLDRSFSRNGKVQTDFGRSASASSAAIDSRGRILVAGYGGPSPGEFALARYHRNGSLDRSFSGNGKVRTDFGGDDYAGSVVVDSRGRIVVAGDSVGGDHPSDVALARYRPDGSLDPSFGSGGKVRAAFRYGAANSVTIGPHDRIVVAGFTNTGGYDFALARFKSNGSPDLSFGAGGKVTTDFGDYDYANSVTIDSRGRIVAAGASCTFPNCRFALARYNPDGSPDGSFATGGKMTTDFGGDDVANSVAIDSRGRIVAAGFGQHEGRYLFALARYAPNGGLDGSFSHNGKATTRFGGGAFANAVGIDGRGRIVAAGGKGSRCCGIDYALTRYNPNGSLDRSFGTRGKVTTPQRHHSVGARTVALDRRDRITVGGGAGKFVLYRYIG